VDPERARLSLEISAFGKGCRGNYTKYGFVLPLREKESISPGHFPGRFGKVQEFLARIQAVHCFFYEWRHSSAFLGSIL